MKLESMSKEELKKLWKEKTTEDAPAEITKAALVEALSNLIGQDPEGSNDLVEDSENLVDHLVTQEDLDANPQLVEAGVQVGETIKVDISSETDEAPAELQPDQISLVKYDEEGNICDRAVMTIQAYNLLPDHKYDWVPEPPNEIA